MKFKWIKRITDYYRDKALAEKCGMVYSDICDHESKFAGHLLEGKWRFQYKCFKCGQNFYK